MRSKELLFAEERKQQIVELINNSDKVTVAQLCDYFKVSSATIRNDLRELENSNLLRRTHGGAMAKSKTGFELDTPQKEGYHLAEKNKIAEAAIDLIDDGDTIIIDTGTTTMELAKRLNRKSNITVVVNDINIARLLEDYEGISIILLGGMVRKQFHCTVGFWGLKIISEISVDKAFIGSNAISSKGISTPDVNQAEMKKAMIAAANKVIVLSDSSKFGKNSFAKFANLSQVDTIITDSGLSVATRKEFEVGGIEIIVAD